MRQSSELPTDSTVPASEPSRRRAGQRRLRATRALLAVTLAFMGLTIAACGDDDQPSKEDAPQKTANIGNTPQSAPEEGQPSASEREAAALQTQRVQDEVKLRYGVDSIREFVYSFVLESDRRNYGGSRTPRQALGEALCASKNMLVAISDQTARYDNEGSSTEYVTVYCRQPQLENEELLVARVREARSDEVQQLRDVGLLRQSALLAPNGTRLATLEDDGGDEE